MKRLLAILLMLLPLWVSAQSNSIYFQRSSEWTGTNFEPWGQGLSMEHTWKKRPYIWSLSLQRINVEDKMGWNYERVLPLLHTDSTFSFYKGKGSFKEVDVRLGLSNFHSMGKWQVYMKAELIMGRTRARFENQIETYTYNEQLGAYTGDPNISTGLARPFSVNNPAAVDVTYRKLGFSMGSGGGYRITQNLEARAGVKIDMHTRKAINADSLGENPSAYPKGLALKPIMQLEWGLGYRF